MTKYIAIITGTVILLMSSVLYYYHNKSNTLQKENDKLHYTVTEKEKQHKKTVQITEAKVSFETENKVLKENVQKLTDKVKEEQNKRGQLNENNIDDNFVITTL